MTNLEFYLEEIEDDDETELTLRLETHCVFQLNKLDVLILGQTSNFCSSCQETHTSFEDAIVTRDYPIDWDYTITYKPIGN